MAEYLVLDQNRGELGILGDHGITPTGEDGRHYLKRLYRAGLLDNSEPTQVQDSSDDDRRLMQLITRTVAEEIAKRERRPRRQVHDGMVRGRTAEAGERCRLRSEAALHATDPLTARQLLLEASVDYATLEEQRAAGADFERAARETGARLQQRFTPKQKQQEASKVDTSSGEPDPEEDFHDQCRRVGQQIANRRRG